MKPTLTTALRSELAQAAATLKQAVATGRTEGAPHFAAIARHQEWVQGEGARLMSGPSAGASDVAGLFTRRAAAVAVSEAGMNAEKQRLLDAVEATQKLQAKVFTTIHQEIKADVRRRLADFYTPARLETVEMTELESRIGTLRVRLSHPPTPRTFAAVLAWAELTQHVLADLAADVFEFTVQPEEAKAA